MKIAIIGHGVVGKNMKKIFNEADIIDPPIGLYPDPLICYDLAFICVPTPPRQDGSCDTSIVEKAIIANRANVFCIKSTIPPGTTDGLAVKTAHALVFSPEFFGATQHANAVDYDFVILGGPRTHTAVVAEAYKAIVPASFRIVKTNAVTAELVKYAENSFLAMKVTFFDEFYRLAENIGIDIDEFREVLLNDPRIGRSHSFTYRDHPWYDSHCLNKDVPAIIQEAARRGVSMPLLRAIVDVNEKHKGRP
jgi:UDPglucose 6-dehydrogenase